MANTMKKVQGRRAIPVARKSAARARTLSLGDLVAAAMDVAGGDANRAAKLLSSRQMAELLGRRIVVE